MINFTSIQKSKGTLPKNKILFFLPLLLLMLLCNSNIYGLVFTSAATGNWANGPTWGNPTSPGTAGVDYPGVNDDVVIAGGFTVTVNGAELANSVEIGGTETLTINTGASLTVSGTNGANPSFEDFTILAGGTVNNNGTLSLDNGGVGGGVYSNAGTFNNNNPGPAAVFTIENGGGYTENGTMTNAGTINVTSTTGSSSWQSTVNITNTGTFNMNANSTYYSSYNNATIPTCTWAATSTCYITGITNSTAPLGLAQNFGNFIWDCGSQGGTISLNGNLTTIQGDLTIINMGTATSRTLQLQTITSNAISIGGNFNMQVSNGTDNFVLTTSGNSTITVGGNFNFSTSSGRLVMSAGGGIATLNVAGNFTYSSATGGYITETSTGKGVIVFNKVGTQTFSTSVTNPFANTIETTINSSSTLDMTSSTANWALQTTGVQTLTVNGTLTTGIKTVTANASTTFTLASGATLSTINASGVNLTIIGAGTRTFDPTANYITGGAATGFTGAGAPTTMNNLTVSSATALDNSITVNGTLTLTSGNFSVGANTLTLNGPTIAGGPTYLSTSASSNLSFGGSAAGVNIPSTVTTLNDLTVNNSNGVTLNSTLPISGTLTLTSGALSIGSNTLTLNSTVTQTGGSISSGNTGTVSYNQVSSGQNIASGTYGNLTLSDFNKMFPSGTVSISNVFTPGTATGHTMTGSTISFNGTGAQSISSAFTYNNLTINNAAGVSIAAGMQTVTGTVAKTSGTLTTNGLLTLVSNAIGDARIDGGSGTVSGNVVVQRYISGVQGYSMIGSPTTNASIADLNASLFTRGFTGSDNPTGTPSIYFYNEATGAYVVPTGDGEAIIPSRATYTYIWSDDLPTAITFTGPTKGGTESFGSVTRSAGGSNIASNPYPSQIDWDADAGWTRTNISSSMYVWNKATSDYRGWQAAPGTTGEPIGEGSNVIALGQAFWVFATAGYSSGDFQCTEVVKTASSATFYKTSSVSNNSLRLKVLDSTNTQYYDDALIKFKPDASTIYEPTTFDSPRLYSATSLIPNLSTLSSDSVKLAINTYPDLSQKYSIPVVVKVNTTGTYIISAQDIDLPASTCIVLEDLQTGAKMDLKTTDSYSFTMVKGVSNTPRFLIHFSPPVAIETTDVSCSGQTDGTIIAKAQADGPWNYAWKDNMGNSIKTADSKNSGDTLSGLNQGTYLLTVTNTGGYCSTVVDSIFISTPDPISIDAISTNVTCNEIADGTAKAIVSGGTYPYNYMWSNGETNQAISNLIKGNYSVTIIDDNNCVKTGGVLITNTNTTANFISNADTLYLSKRDSVLLTNTSTGADNYSWNFGDGTIDSTSINPTHNYSKEGEYTIRLISKNNSCEDSIEHNISVLAAPLAIVDNKSEFKKEILIINQSNGILVQFNFQQEQSTRIKLYNVLGQEIWRTVGNLKIKNDALPINLNEHKSGIYFLTLEMNGNYVSKKIIFTK